MEPERWHRVRDLFEKLVEMPAGERAARVELACGGDVALRRQVESLLAADEAASSFLEEPAWEQGAGTDGWKPGRRLGRYRLLEPIAQGGMAGVYLAIRDDNEYEQRVAIKVFGRGVDRPDLVRRFRAERQILASLVHPNIARLLDGGTTEEGLPYIVMEHIEGLPIDAYCDRYGLTVDERLELFATLCGAVHFAHRNLVVHCDLKPANVLVDAEGVPKLLDFGIARLLDRAAGWALDGHRLMTPSYASPEQIAGAQVTTASDVYALGVLLYQLLTGHLPYRLGEGGELERAILEEEPERPSLTGRRGLRRRLAGDLDAITLMALRKDPERRYASAAQLAEDLGRSRQGQPVTASRGTVAYRTRKFVRRHRFGVGVACGFAALVAAATVFLAVLAVRLAEERDRVRRENDKAMATVGFLEEIFDVTGANAERGEDVTARQLLDWSAERVGRDLAEQPDVEASLSGTIGGLYRKLGFYGQAEPLLLRALELRRALPGAGDLEMARNLHDLGLLRLDQRRFAAAEPLLRQALELRRRTLGDEHLAVAESLSALGLAHGINGDLARARPLFEESFTLRRKLLDPEHPLVAESLAELGRVHRYAGELAKAEELYRESLRITRKRRGDHHLEVAQRLSYLATVLRLQGDLTGAEAAASESLEITRAVFGEGHLRLAEPLCSLAALRILRRDLAGAQPLLHESLRLEREHLGEEHPDLAGTLSQLGELSREKGDVASAERFYREAWQLLESSLGPEHPWTGHLLVQLAAVLRDQDRLAEAGPLFERALRSLRVRLDEEHPWLAAALREYGRFELARGEPPHLSKPRE